MPKPIVIPISLIDLNVELDKAIQELLTAAVAYYHALQGDSDAALKLAAQEQLDAGEGFAVALENCHNLRGEQLLGVEVTGVLRFGPRRTL